MKRSAEFDKPESKKSFTFGKSISHHRWTEDKVALILDFLEKNKDFQKPSARIYYQKFCAENPIGVDWCLVNWKVRNLKLSYTKVRAWLKSEEAREITRVKGEDFIRDITLKKCPYFDRMDGLFKAGYFPLSYENEGSAPGCPRSSNEDSNEIQNVCDDAIDDPTAGIKFLIRTDSSQLEITHTPPPYVASQTSTIAQAKVVLDAETLQMPTAQIPTVALPPLIRIRPVVNAEPKQSNKYDFPTVHPKRECTNAPEKSPTEPSLEDLAEIKMHHEEMAMERRKIKENKKIEMRRLALEKRKLELMADWQNKLFAMKQAELQSNESLAKLELELKYSKSDSD